MALHQVSLLESVQTLDDALRHEGALDSAQIRDALNVFDDNKDGTLNSFEIRGIAEVSGSTDLTRFLDELQQDNVTNIDIIVRKFGEFHEHLDHEHEYRPSRAA